MGFADITSAQIVLTDANGRDFVIIDPIERARQYAKLEETQIAHELQRIRERREAVRIRRRELRQLKDEISRELGKRDAEESAA
jgi:hypothetical protein